MKFIKGCFVIIILIIVIGLLAYTIINSINKSIWDRQKQESELESRIEKQKEKPTTEEEVTREEETTEEVKEEIRKYAILSGIENDELVVPEINLWSDYGENRIAKGAKVVGIVKHNSEVQILEEAVDGKTKFYKVKSPDNLIGWVSENFVTDIIEK